MKMSGCELRRLCARESGLRMAGIPRSAHITNTEKSVKVSEIMVNSLST